MMETTHPIMKRYRVTYSTAPSGAWSEFSAGSDDEALAHAEQRSHGAGIVSLGEVTWPHGFRPIALDKAK